MRLFRRTVRADSRPGCLPDRRLSSHEIPEASEPYVPVQASGLDLSRGNSSVSGRGGAGTAHAQSFTVETLTWGSQQTRSRWATLTGARPLPDDLKQGPLVLTIFVVTQLLDGLLTYWGVTRFGIELEMNTLLAQSMHFFGPGAALFAAKGLACACGLVLYCNAYLRPLAAVAGLCLGLAVIPWIAVLSWTI
jgi:hypothetical protein